MKTKNLSFEDFQEKKISKNGLKSIFGGEIPPPKPGTGIGNGTTGGSGTLDNPDVSNHNNGLLPELVDPI